MSRENRQKSLESYLKEKEKALAESEAKVSDRLNGVNQATKWLETINGNVDLFLAQGELNNEEKEALSFWSELQLKQLHKLRAAEDLLKTEVKERDFLQDEINRVRRELRKK